MEAMEVRRFLKIARFGDMDDPQRLLRDTFKERRKVTNKGGSVFVTLCDPK